jgi:quercetin dioxygenase-like cupin family protein
MYKKINWESVPTEIVNSKMERKLVYGDKIMVARMKIKDGFRVPLHRHHHEQITQVISGTMRFWLGENREETLELSGGDVLVIPSDLPHEALMVGDVEEMDIWTPLREDWLDGSDNYLRIDDNGSGTKK